MGKKLYDGGERRERCREKHLTDVSLYIYIIEFKKKKMDDKGNTTRFLNETELAIDFGIFRRHEYRWERQDGLKGRQSQTRGNFIDIFIEYLACKSIEYMLPYQLNIITW